jgi:hypothetical protein
MVLETMAEFYVVGAHPWVASAQFSAVPPGPPLLLHALSPEEMTRMLLDHGAAIRGIHEELALFARAPEGRAVAAVCVPSCLVGGSTPDAVYRTIRSGDGGEDALDRCPR